MALPANVTRIWVRGTFTSTNGAPVTRTTSFSPNAPVLVDYTANEIIANAGVSAVPDANGLIAVQLIATDDPDLTPTRWNYKVVDSVGQKYNLTVPVNTPVWTNPDDPDDPLNGQQVIELRQAIRVPGASGGIGLLINGVGIASMVNDGDGNIVVHYDDGTSETVDGPFVTDAGGETYDYLVQEVVNRQVADGKLQVAIDRRYRFDPAVGIPERDLSDGVTAKLNASLSGSSGSASLPPRGSLGDRHFAEDAGIAERRLSLASDAHPATPSRRTLGRGPLQAMPGNTSIPVPGTDVPPLVSGLVPASYLPDGSVAGAPLDTATKPTPLGVPTPGVSTRSSPADHVHPRQGLVLPSDHGLITWSFDPAHAASSGTATAGVLQMVRLYIPYAQTVTGILLSAITAGSGLTNCYTALFDASRNLLGQSANLATLWGTTTGDKKGDLATPVAITTPGFYYAGWWNGGGTSPAWARSTAVVTSVNNWNLAAASARFATSTTGLTTTAPSTAATLALSGSSYLVGLY